MLPYENILLGSYFIPYPLSFFPCKLTLMPSKSKQWSDIVVTFFLWKSK